MSLRPSGVTETYVEREYDALAAEQVELWEAESANAEQAPSAQRDDSRRASDEAMRHMEEHRSTVAEAQRVSVATYAALHPFRHREPGAKKWYLARWALLLGGDVAGQVGAALSYGESPWTAVPQALATGMAALTAGMVGTELRQLRDTQRRSQDEDELPETLVPWAHLFREPDLGQALARLVIWIGLGAGLGVAGGIFMLRMIIEGPGAGLVYGLLAIGITLASAVNSYFYADEIADQIDAANTSYRTELKLANELANGPSVIRHASASAEAELTGREHQARGRAADKRMQALKWRVLGNNPEVAGHGLTSPQPGGESS